MIKAGTPVSKGRINPLPYIEKARIARVTIGLKRADLARIHGGKRVDSHAAPIPTHLKVDDRKLRASGSLTRKVRNALLYKDNPPTYTTFGGLFKVRA